ncbi:unnamed protein product [Clonostachys rosea]|uniref:HNH nuclease domain-containing protein n=1 Tax=Bionectria ochroleuca TaxID=29856 RepID=A0ABY6UL16_BIOOC|nr:unnamed protein product [Clonostachys rosea]
MNQRGDRQVDSHSSRLEAQLRRRPSTFRYYLAVLQRVMYSKHPAPTPVPPPANPSLAPAERDGQSLPPTPPPSPVNTIFQRQHMAPHSCPADRIVPSFIRPWDGFEAGQQARLGCIHSHLPDSVTILPPVDQLAELESLMLSESRTADSGSKLVQIFFHYAVEVPVAQIISVLSALPGSRHLRLMGDVHFPSHLDTFSTTSVPPGRNTQEQEQRCYWLIPSQTYVYRRDDEGIRTKVPICVNQYHSPDDLNLLHLQAGLGTLSSLSEPLTHSRFGRLREVGDSPNWTLEERKVLLALTNAHTVMVKSGLSFGVVATGDAILFLNLDWESPGTLFFKLMNPTVDDIKIEDGRIHSNGAAVAQCLSFYLHALSDVFQKETNPRVAIPRGSHCAHSFASVSESSPLERGANHYPEADAGSPRLVPNWPQHICPPEPPPATIYANSLQLTFALGPSPNPFTEIVACLNSHSVSPIYGLRSSNVDVGSDHSIFHPSTVLWTKSFQFFEQNTSSVPIAIRNVATIQGVEASEDCLDTPSPSHQSTLPPIALCSAGAEVDYFAKLPPIASTWMGHAAQKFPIALGGVQAGSPCSRLPTLLPRSSHSNQPQASQISASSDEEMTRRLAVHIRHRQETPNEPPRTERAQPPQPSEDDQPHREDTPDGGHDAYNGTQADEVHVKVEPVDGVKEETYSNADHQERGPAPAHSLSQSTDGPSAMSLPDVSSTPYCTQLCLLGLITGQVADFDCPNVDCHRRVDEASDHTDRRHMISHAMFLDLVRGAIHEANHKNHKVIHGNVFKMTLSEYGYTFVYKSFEDFYKLDMDHEVDVYNRLIGLQGKHVPIFLGHVSLQHDVEEDPVHYTLMSSAGVPVANLDNRSALVMKADEAIRDFHARNVFYRLTLHNTFFDEFQKTVILAGLGRARIVDSPEPEPSNERGAAGGRRASDDATAAHQGRPSKRRRTEPGSSSYDPKPMSLARMADMVRLGLVDDLLHDIGTARRLLETDDSEQEN